MSESVGTSPPRFERAIGRVRGPLHVNLVERCESIAQGGVIFTLKHDTETQPFEHLGITGFLHSKERQAMSALAARDRRERSNQRAGHPAASRSLFNAQAEEVNP